MNHDLGKGVTKAVFPVAGLGTRFVPATKASPKEILVLVDKPLIQYAIEEAQASVDLGECHPEVGADFRQWMSRRAQKAA